jgi:hypothetical protein
MKFRYLISEFHGKVLVGRGPGAGHDRALEAAALKVDFKTIHLFPDALSSVMV